MPDETPEAFGIDGLTKEFREVKKLLLKQDILIDWLKKNQIEGERRLSIKLERIERTMSEQFPQTRAELESLRSTVADIGQRLTTEIQQIKDKIDSLTVPVNEQPIVEEIKVITDNLKGYGERLSNIIPDNPTPGKKGG